MAARSAVSPDQDMASTTSPFCTMPRSPWPASAAWTKVAGRPVEASVAAILRATRPDFPMPVTITRPGASAIVLTASSKEAPRLFGSREAKAASSDDRPSRATPRVLRADRTGDFDGAFMPALITRLALLHPQSGPRALWLSRH